MPLYISKTSGGAYGFKLPCGRQAELDKYTLIKEALGRYKCPNETDFRYTHNLWDITQNASAERRFELKSVAGRVFRRESVAKPGVSPMLDPYFGSEYWITEHFHPVQKPGP